ncbi:hypothetical protein CAOG_05834 [Capsaspora owczarzaki ATCC 30864]|uniref:Uncharacterized protein n=1 Tax=Capsaspora owczarzaki (strain ATCC 30864) TaxID=595528 RepID=A0A0D2UJV1_CAPO3|nr:hypothetical protein CAOG_05834 [Capsaspora owczarzaki ATCC 30864]KJE95381.1 hypothetical protein CAOG_005834 [Capsaspora owczarzaki ATCC 30864]|eukprot:XP_004345424.1 hypothetical protein CAOG_05834 [Capsaspora owczarzaki ATCC 30864]
MASSTATVTGSAADSADVVVDARLALLLERSKVSIEACIAPVELELNAIEAARADKEAFVLTSVADAVAAAEADLQTARKQSLRDLSKTADDAAWQQKPFLYL